MIGGRFGGGSALIENDDLTEFMIFGGYGHANEAGLNRRTLCDVWFFNLNNHTWKWVEGNESYSDTDCKPLNYGTPNVSDNISVSPGARNIFAFVQLSNEEYLIYGGSDYNDVFIYNVSDNLWKNLHPGNTSIHEDILYNGEMNKYHKDNLLFKRKQFSYWLTNNKKELFIFGGLFTSNGNKFLSDLWAYSIDKNMWKMIMNNGKDFIVDYGKKGVFSNDTKPFQRKRSTAFYFLETGYYYIFGGENSGVIADLLIFNDETMELKWENSIGYNIPTFIYSDDYNTQNRIGGRYDPVVNVIGNEIFIYSGWVKNIGFTDIWSVRVSYECNGFYEYEYGVCNNKGNCIHNKCVCNNDAYGENCELFKCNNILSNNSNACNGKGICRDNYCDCLNLYGGNNCQLNVCNKKLENDTNVCLGNGWCDYEGCKCYYGFYGSECEKTDLNKAFMDNYWYIVYIILPILISIFALIFMTLFCICCLIINIRKKKLKKLDLLEDVDLILEEKRLEEEIGNITKLKINKKLFEVNHSDLNILKVVGDGESSGCTSIVYKCEYNDIVVAFKSFQIMNYLSSQDSFDELEKEISIYISISHKNIVKFYGSLLKAPRIGILVEWCSNGNLIQFMEKYQKINKKKIPVDENIRYLKEISSALLFLHSKNIIHRNLKLKNILVNITNDIKIMDFGLSKIIENDETTKTMRIGNSIFMAPEVFLSSKYSEKCDVFSFGIIMFCIINGTSEPYGNLAQVSQNVALDENYRPKIKDELFKNYKEIIPIMKSCWSHDPKLRPSFEELFEEFSKKKIVKNDEELFNVEMLVQREKDLEDQLEKLKKKLKKSV